MIARTSLFFDSLSSRDYNIIIPTPVLGEILVPVPIHEHSEILSKIGKNMILASYDPKSAALFAHMFRAYRNSSELKEYREFHCVPRERIKVDYMITAIAITNRAECIYSEDRHIKTFAGTFIDVRPIPDTSAQLPLQLN